MNRSSAGARQTIIAAGISFALFASPWVIPVVGMMLSLWCPTPLLWLYRRKEARAGRVGVLLALTAVIIVFQFMDLSWAGYYFLFYAALAAVLGEAPAWGLAEDRAMGAAALAGLAMALLVFLGAALASGLDFDAMLKVHWQRELSMVLGMYGQMGVKPEALMDLRQTLETVGGLFYRLSAGLLTVGSLLVAWANLLFVRSLIRRRDHQAAALMRPLIFWKAPERLVWLLIAAGALMVLAEGFWFWAGANLVMILGVLYFFQGLAVLAFWLAKKNVPPFLRTGIYILLALEFFLAVLVAAAGLFDLWFNFRRLNSQKPA